MGISSLPSGSSSNVSNDFSISVGSSGHTNVSLSSTFPVGSYICTSSLSDSSLDIYFIAPDGTSAGYANATTSTTSVDALKPFNKVVIYGASNNDTLSFQFKYVFSPSNVTDNFAAAPRLISTSLSDLPNLDNTTVLTGQNFATDVQITFTGTDNIERSAKSIVRSSATSLIVTRPDTMPATANPYTITATNPGIASPISTNFHKLSNSTTAGNAPVWVTGTTLTTFYTDVAYSVNISATDSDGGSSVTYSLVSGSLPTSMSLNPNTGVISGTSSQRSNSTFTIRATDSGGNFVDRLFTLPYQDVPVAPTIGTVTDVGTARPFNNAAATVSFTPVITNPNITGYTVTSSPGGYTATGTSSPITVTGLQSNTNYTFTVRANNSYGSSAPSSTSNQILATTVPQVPTIGTPTKSTTAGVVNVNFTGNATGGKAVTYTATSSGGQSASGASSPVAVGGLTQGASFTFTVVATNANGSSSASATSSPINAPAQQSQTFTASGTWTNPGVSSAEVILVGGGGGGGFINGAKNGGGGGGVYWNTALPVSGNLSISIGGGGSSQSNGNSTTVSGGASATATGGNDTSQGFSGLGGVSGNTVRYSSVVGQYGNASNGGAGAGGNSASGADYAATNGGPGFYVSSVNTTYAGGGGGWANNGGSPGSGVNGGGFGGFGYSGSGGSGTNNTGGGGGASGVSTPGGSGGSGVAIVRWVI